MERNGGRKRKIEEKKSRPTRTGEPRVYLWHRTRGLSFSRGSLIPPPPPPSLASSTRMVCCLTPKLQYFGLRDLFLESHSFHWGCPTSAISVISLVGDPGGGGCFRCYPRCGCSALFTVGTVHTDTCP